MEIDKKHIKTIRTQFGKMKTKEELLALLNYVKTVLYGEKAIPFSLKQLNYHYTPKANSKRYIQFTIKKKSGSERVISSPNNGLKEIQKCLNLVFQLIHEPNPAANGFVSGKSIVDNAIIHSGSFYVYNIDLKDFFPSIDQARVWGRLKKSPFNLNENQKRLDLANIIASLCCHEMEVERMDNTGAFVKVLKSVLPQGAPTSPTLSNIICERLDIRLSGVAKRFGLKYSRYADDITFSSMHNVYQKNSEFLIEIARIITDQNFYIKESKTRLQKQGFRQEVTGLIVNDKPNVNKRYISELRMWIYYWEQYGYQKASSFFKPRYIADKGHVKKGTPSLENVLAGKLEYLKMVRGAKNTVYIKLSERIKKLESKVNPLNEVIFILEKEGIEKAMVYYYSNTTTVIGINSIYNLHLSKSKIDFISDLLASKSLDLSMKQKFFELVAHELRNEFLNMEKLNALTLVKLIKNKIGTQGTLDNMVKESHPNNTLPKYKNPREISEFLLSFNQNIILKSITHNIDTNLLISINDFLNIQEYSFVKHLDAIKKEFSNLTEEYSITRNLFAKISAYINGINMWSEDKIGISWSSQELSRWAVLHAGKCPNPEKDLSYEPFKFDKKVRLKNGSILKDFNDLTMFFKKQLTIRSDNNLYDLCREWNFFFKDKVSFIIVPQYIPRNIEFFTDVEKLQQAYKEIINLCIEESENNNEAKPEIQIGLKETKNESQETIIVFSIWHKNSKFNKTLDATLNRYGKSFTGLITNQLNGLCDWELIADFGNNTSAKVSLWPNKKEVESLSNFEGVQFNLIFYR